MRILLVTTRFPWPPRRGDQLRALQIAGWLASEHDVSMLVPAVGSPPAGLPFSVERYPVSPLAAAPGLVRALARGWPLQSALFDSPGLRAAIRRLAPRSDLAVVQLVRLAPQLAAFGGVPLVVDLIDSLALNFARRADFDRPWMRPALRWEARRLRRWERRLVEAARLTLLVSARDRQHVVAGLPEAAADRVRVLPLAVAAPVEARPAAPATDSPRIALTGNLGYFPTVEGMRWWLREVWPELRRRCPSLRLTLAGERPAPSLRRACAGAGGVELDAAPEEIGAVLARAQLAIAPARCGSGVPMKVLEAWAAGVPVVASPWSAAGTTAVAGRELLVADTAAAWREAILALLANAGECARFAAAGRARLLADYGPERLGGALLAAVRTVLA